MPPAQKPHRSKQDYETPVEFIEALKARFGGLAWDLACTPENAKAGYLCADTFQLDWWELEGNLFCNPPFGDIARWVKKMHAQCTHRSAFTLLLVPASIGTNWFAEHVAGNAMVLGLSPRLSFVGCSDAYPKDLMIVCYGFSLRGFDTWCWK